MSSIAFIVLGIYTLSLFYITLYCVLQFNLLYFYKKKSNQQLSVEESAPIPGPAIASRQLALAEAGPAQPFSGLDAGLEDEPEVQPWPFVTIQLPVYNELYVMERLIDCITQFDYPKDRFEIQIVDDSTDESVEITRQKVEAYKALGFQIEQIRRPVRQGYKAGALKDAMPFAKGEFIAIFDADFLPKRDFLKKTIPHFKDPSVGVVQTRWEHINEDYSLITQLQALQLNVHFTVEQAGRMRGNYLLQFNGTAGVWRRKTIDDAGGWEADTLTEDLDLSIRAQLKGWKIHFLEDVTSPAELPAEMNSLKSQQFRWMKGGAETAKKMLPTVWRSDLSPWKKIQSTAHLLSSTVFLFVFITGFSSVPLLFYLDDLINMGFSKNFFAWFMAGLLSIIAIYFVANVQATHKNLPFGKSLVRFLKLFPMFLAMSMGLSLHNSVAVIEGWRGKKSPFVRTPKFNIKSGKDSFAKNKYVTAKLSWTTIFEGLLAVYYTGAIAAAIWLQNTTFLFFHLTLAVGFGTIFYYTVRHLKVK
ncbi:MAG: glycosyltransferase [Lewinellaceae bacterium]|nr:glycosyltransferase family 2 protein [Lewinella sp.]MCB9279471.1 glycosyltransferase [Lewinellaceae bacterium]